MKKKGFLLFLLAVTAAAGAACGQAAPGPDAGRQAAGADRQVLGAEPITLTFYNTTGTLPDTEFKTLIADPIKAKYPDVTIERIVPAAETTLEEVLSTHAPDIIYSTSSSHQRVLRLGAYEDLRPYIEKYGFDESRLKPILYDYIKEITKGRGDAVIALPFNSNQHVLYYNKDIFDRFGVPYPPDRQMTWEETLELARQLTRTDNGVHYIGLSVDNLTGLAKGLGLELLDRETHRALLDTPDWRRVFELNKRIFEIPGYVTPDGTWNWGRDHFMKDQVVAMRVTWLANMVGPLEELRQQGIEFNWDIAPAPNFPDRLGYTREAQVHTLSVNRKSRHKDEAFLVIAEILSDEWQRMLARNGRIPAIVKPELDKEYGLDIPVLQGKSVGNVFIGEPLQEHYFHPFELDVLGRLTEAAEDMAVGGLDVNSAIRKASEAINRDVETLIQIYGEP